MVRFKSVDSSYYSNLLQRLYWSKWISTLYPHSVPRLVMLSIADVAAKATPFSEPQWASLAPACFLLQLSARRWQQRAPERVAAGKCCHQFSIVTNQEWPLTSRIVLEVGWISAQISSDPSQISLRRKQSAAVTAKSWISYSSLNFPTSSSNSVLSL